MGVHETREKAGAPCGVCTKSKELMKLIGGSETKMIFNYVGEVGTSDNWQEALYKIKRGIGRYSFMQKMPDSRKYYAEWHKRYVRYKRHHTVEETAEQDDMKDNSDEPMKVDDPDMNLTSDPGREDQADEWSKHGLINSGIWHSPGRVPPQNVKGGLEN